MTRRILPFGVAVLTAALLSVPGAALAAEGKDDMVTMPEQLISPMVELPRGMDMRDIPESMVMMLDTPSGRKAFVPWYATRKFASMSEEFEGSSMPEGVMMQTPDGSFVFLPWYLSPQFADMLMHEDKMDKGMKMMESEGMSFVYVPWYDKSRRR